MCRSKSFCILSAPLSVLLWSGFWPSVSAFSVVIRPSMFAFAYTRRGSIAGDLPRLRRYLFISLDMTDTCRESTPSSNRSLMNILRQLYERQAATTRRAGEVPLGQPGKCRKLGWRWITLTCAETIWQCRCLKKRPLYAKQPLLHHHKFSCYHSTHGRCRSTERPAPQPPDVAWFHSQLLA